jgi:hypothetical protein
MDLCQFFCLADRKLFIVAAKLEIMDPTAASRTGCGIYYLPHFLNASFCFLPLIDLLTS